MNIRKIILTAILLIGLMISMVACGHEETIITSDSPTTTSSTANSTNK